jgi:hypothetical protein
MPVQQKNIQIVLPEWPLCSFHKAIWIFFTMIYLDVTAILKWAEEKRRPKSPEGWQG